MTILEEGVGGGRVEAEESEVEVEGSRRWAQKGDWDLSSVSFRRKLDRADRFWSRGLVGPGLAWSKEKDRAGTQQCTSG